MVRKFVHLLEQSALDLQEEQEVTRLREEVVTKIRSNQQMEKDLNLMDIKIGLLVKNRITLQVRNPSNLEINTDAYFFCTSCDRFHVISMCCICFFCLGTVLGPVHVC